MVPFLTKLYVKQSGFIDTLEENDDVMADRGFNIRHLVLSKRATLNIPAFIHGKSLSKKAVTRSRKIASVRIHVERAMHMKNENIKNNFWCYPYQIIIPHQSNH